MSHRIGALLYDFVFWTSGPGFTLLNSLRTEGARHIPPKGPVLLLANHQSYFDPVLVGLAARRHLTFLARDSLFRNRFFGRLITILSAVPIDQEGIGIGGLKTIIKELHAGNAVLVFPEGTRTPDGALHPLQPGIHLLIKRAQPPIIPVGIAGAYDAWPIWGKIPRLAPLFLPARPATIAISIGKPLTAETYRDLSREEFLQALTRDMYAIKARAEQLRRKPRRFQS